jgi:superfamily II DNA helicase RecQ
VVFDNRTLVAIARDAPTTLIELGHVPGVGPTKLDRYGEAVLELLRDLRG